MEKAAEIFLENGRTEDEKNRQQDGALFRVYRDSEKILVRCLCDAFFGHIFNKDCFSQVDVSVISGSTLCLSFCMPGFWF